jgi:hypothetical protein
LDREDSMTRRWVTLVFGSIALAGCAGGSTLDGSATSAASLTFDTVQAEWVSDQIVVRYLSSQGVPVPGEPLRLIMDRALVTEGQDIPAVPGLGVGHYVVTRAPAGDLVQEPPLPSVDHGHIHFDRAGSSVGQAVGGDFSLIFVDGSNLDGTFHTSVTAPGQ